MLNTARRRARQAGDDAGITLTELVVTMSLLTIVGTLALTFFIGSTRTADATTDAGLSTASARSAVSAWTAMLQAAVPPDPANPTVRDLVLTPSSISFAAGLQNRNGSCSAAGTCTTGAPTAVTLASQSTTVDGRPVTRLVQTLTKSSNATTTYPVPSGVGLPSGTSCLFTAFDAAGTDLGCSLTGPATARVARIDLAFTATLSGGATQTYRTTVALPGIVR